MSLPSTLTGHAGSRTFHCHRTLQARAPAAGGSQISRLVAMNSRLEARLHALGREREKLARLLAEADAALAAAGIPYVQDNIRERISAWQVFRRVQIFPL